VPLEQESNFRITYGICFYAGTSPTTSGRRAVVTFFPLNTDATSSAKTR
jgi:hypothetical protein